MSLSCFGPTLPTRSWGASGPQVARPALERVTVEWRTLTGAANPPPRTPPSQGGETKRAGPPPFSPLRRGGSGGFFGRGPLVSRNATVKRSRLCPRNRFPGPIRLMGHGILESPRGSPPRVAGDPPRSHAPAWECRLRRSASRPGDTRGDAERPGRHSHAERGNEGKTASRALVLNRLYARQIPDRS